MLISGERPMTRADAGLAVRQNPARKAVSNAVRWGLIVPPSVLSTQRETRSRVPRPGIRAVVRRELRLGPLDLPAVGVELRQLQPRPGVQRVSGDHGLEL